MAINISNHITNTNNTLILGRLNDDENAPSLSRALEGVDVDMESVIDSIFDGDDTQRLAVNDISDVTKIFEPTYFFSIGKAKVEGFDVMVVKQTPDRREKGFPVKLTRESLCYRILESNGNLELDDIISLTLKSLGRGRDHYVKAIESRIPARIKNQEIKRHELISQLMEPVVCYMIVAQSVANYRIKEEDTDSSEGTERGEEIVIMVPFIDNEKGIFELRPQTIKPPEDPAPPMVETDEKPETVGLSELETDIRKGQEYLAAAVEGYFRSVPDENDMTAPKQKLLISLVESGIAEELQIDHIEEGSPVHGLLTTKFDNYLLENNQLILEDKSKTDDNQGGTSQILPYIKRDLTPHRLRSLLPKEKLKSHIKTVETNALAYFKDEKDKQDKISCYLYTLTPVGQKKNKFTEIENRPNGEKDIRGEKGLEAYIELCIEEAAENSEFVFYFKEFLRNGLLKKPYFISEENEKKCQEHHGRLLEMAKKTFQEYLTKIFPLAAQLKGIDAFLETAMSAKDRMPKVLIANMDAQEILDDSRKREQFEKFISTLDDVNLRAFERAVSIVIAPKMDDYYKDDFLKIANEKGFIAFFSSKEPIQYNELNDPDKIKELTQTWSSKSPSNSSGVLCLPDTILIQKGFKFGIGENPVTKRKEIFELKDPVVIPSCFLAAGLVARNDDTKFADEKLKDAVRLKKEWPCIGMELNNKTAPLWESDRISDGVILEKNLEKPLPFCIFEHSQNAQGRANKLRIRHLNTLFIIDGALPISVWERRVATYLSRALKLYCKENGKHPTDNEFTEFCKKLDGIYSEATPNSIIDKERFDLIYNGEGYMRVQRKDDEASGTSISVDIHNPE